MAYCRAKVNRSSIQNDSCEDPEYSVRGVPDFFLVINTFHIGPYGPTSRKNWPVWSNCFLRGFVLAFLSGHKATCDFPGVGVLTPCPLLIHPFKRNGLIERIYFQFKSRCVVFIFCRTFCQQTVKTLIRRHVLWRLIWVCIVCLCPISMTLGVNGLKSGL